MANIPGDAFGSFRHPFSIDHDAVTLAWSSYPSLVTPRHGLGVAAVGGVIFADGGGPSRGNSYTDVVETFQP